MERLISSKSKGVDSRPNAIRRTIECNLCLSCLDKRVGGGGKHPADARGHEMEIYCSD